jgi:hypothetical protein
MGVAKHAARHADSGPLTQRFEGLGLQQWLKREKKKKEKQSSTDTLHGKPVVNEDEHNRCTV